MTNNSHLRNKKNFSFKKKQYHPQNPNNSQKPKSNQNIFERIQVSKQNVTIRRPFVDRHENPKKILLNKPKKINPTPKLQNKNVVLSFFRKNLKSEFGHQVQPKVTRFDFENEENFTNTDNLEKFLNSEKLNHLKIDFRSFKQNQAYLHVKKSNNVRIYNMYQSDGQYLNKRNASQLQLNPTEYSRLKTTNSTRPKSSIRRAKFEVNLVSKQMYQSEFDQISQKFEQVIDRFKNSYSKWVAFPRLAPDGASPETKPRPFHIVEFEPIRHQPAFRNLVKNSFLKLNNVDFQNQLEASFDKILEMLQQEAEVEYSVENVLLLLNLQLPVNLEQFDMLSARIKLKIICFLFAKFVDKDQLFQIFCGFLEDLEFTNDFRDFFDR